ncbi:hypothetical protein Shyhy01_40900 [Streptomyces hygroscopicus subsp. hygroscopicus]|uniref:hypothetical protein n=1 Tax=Streptomyces sp. KHY 26 TaxID=3097359 RepID=UPI0024A4B213|nr:hypothetical protein [Streptomyces hygroscopicus]GLX51140.1 hypothetical protein Shyhy01_40900 [Streptomyces hygroscopicus subsp. hygroscopicus]
MEHGDDTRPRVTGPHPPPAGAVAHDGEWAGEVRTAVRCAAALFALLLCVDGAAGSLTWWRGLLWCALALLLFLVLYPARVSAGDGWLASRRLLRTRRVHTGLLVAVRPLDGVARRLVLCDLLGNRVEIDPEVLARNPVLWRRLDEGVRAALAGGTLRCGTTALAELARRLDRETALAVFRASGLE